MNIIELKMPDLGEHHSASIIVIDIKEGEHIDSKQKLITVKTDHSLMDIPAETAGVIKKISVNVGDHIGAGEVIALLETACADSHAEIEHASTDSSASPTISHAKCIVIKVGSSLVTAEGRGIDQNALNHWAEQITAAKQHGCDIILVSSGAIAEGIKRLGWHKRPSAVNELQAAAAIGQMGIAQAYEKAFAPHGIHTAQILLTHDDLSHRTRYLNARSTLQTLLAKNIVPIINENDTVTTDEIKLGDNDTLAALVTNLVDADALIILTDQRGLYDRDPRKNPNAQFISYIHAEHPELENMAGGAGTGVGTGGMYTKILAAKRAALSGATTIVASGREPNIIQRLLGGESIGTLFTSALSRINARKQWLRGHIQTAGSVIIDQGAQNALLHQNSSLLPIGCLAIHGHFQRGELIAIHNENGQEIARGLSNYSSMEAQKILHRHAHEIVSQLGYANEDELIHRDNLALTINFRQPEESKP